jgi:hypothetical protein
MVFFRGSDGGYRKVCVQFERVLGGRFVVVEEELNV